MCTVLYQAQLNNTKIFLLLDYRYFHGDDDEMKEEKHSCLAICWFIDINYVIKQGGKKFYSVLYIAMYGAAMLFPGIPT